MRARVSKNEWIFFSLNRFYDDELAEFWINGWKSTPEKYRRAIVRLEEDVKRFTELHGRIKKLRKAGLSEVEIGDKIHEDTKDRKTSQSIDTKEPSDATNTQQIWFKVYVPTILYLSRLNSFAKVA